MIEFDISSIHEEELKRGIERTNEVETKELASALSLAYIRKANALMVAGKHQKTGFRFAGAGLS